MTAYNFKDLNLKKKKIIDDIKKMKRALEKFS